MWRRRTVEFWKSLIGRGARISVPCAKATAALLASRLPAHRQRPRRAARRRGFLRRVLHPRRRLPAHGTGRGRPGRRGRARPSSPTSRRQRPDGRFESQTNQFDANGQALWALWQYCKITGDRAWLEQAYPQMRRAADWTMQGPPQGPGRFAVCRPAARRPGRRRIPLGRQAPHRRLRLLEPARAALHGRRRPACWASSRGRRAADGTRPRTTARPSTRPGKRTGVAHFPPSWEKAGTHWGNTETLWPTRALRRRRSRAWRPRSTTSASGTAAASSRARSAGSAPRTRSIPTCRPTPRWPPWSAASDEQVVEDFYWYLLHSTATHAFPEGIFYKRAIRLERHHPARHRRGQLRPPAPPHAGPRAGDELHLLAAVPDGWLADGQSASSGRRRTSARSALSSGGGLPGSTSSGAAPSAGGRTRSSSTCPERGGSPARSAASRLSIARRSPSDGILRALSRSMRKPRRRCFKSESAVGRSARPNGRWGPFP